MRIDDPRPDGERGAYILSKIYTRLYFDRIKLFLYLFDRKVLFNAYRATSRVLGVIVAVGSSLRQYIRQRSESHTISNY